MWHWSLAVQITGMQLPEPSQMPASQKTPPGTGVWAGCPAVQMPIVHAAACGGTSELSITLTTLPAPSHWFL